MLRYAQINKETGQVVSISFLAGKVEEEHMITLPENADVRPGDIYTNGEWTRPEPEPVPEPGPTEAERMTTLEAEKLSAQSSKPNLIKPG